MSPAKKFFLDASDDLKIVLKIIASTKDNEVILILPHNSSFGRVLDNFEALKKELKKSKKSIVFESANEKILQLAETAGFRVSHPFFRKEERIFSDIVSSSSKLESVEPKKIAFEDLEIEEEEVEGPAAAPQFSGKKEEKSQSAKLPRPRRPLNARKLFIRVMISAGFAAILLAALMLLPKATINLSLKKFESSFEKAVAAGIEIKESEIKNGKIFLAGELLTAKNNIQMSFPASGRENVQDKARGKLKIYNAFSSQSQTLVATTRFEAPNGKIYRLEKQTVVPAAKVVSGKIEPAFIEAQVTADAAGPEYNMKAPVGKWLIPGFKGTPRYDGFYAEAAGDFSSGFVGEKMVATAEDLQKARTEIEKVLESNLLSQVAVLLAGDLKVLPDAQFFSVLSFQKSDTAEPGQFGIFAEAELRYFVFSEKDLMGLIVGELESSIEQSQNINLELEDFSAEYDKTEFDLENGAADFAYKGEAVFRPAFNESLFIGQVLGLSENQLREKMMSVPGLEKGKISLWPFWVKSAPRNADKIELKLE